MEARITLVPLILSLLLLSSGCISSPANPPTHTGGPESPWAPDGAIKGGEYTLNRSTADGSFWLFLRVENGTLFVGMKARTRGWLAVGFGGGLGMKETDIVIAYVLPNGTVMIRDDYSTGFAGPHNPDTEYGGREDVVSYGGREAGDFTIVEFSRRLDTGDRYDFEIPLGESFRVIWAYGSMDDFLSDHSRAGGFYIAIGGG